MQSILILAKFKREVSLGRFFCVVKYLKLATMSLVLGRKSNGGLVRSIGVKAFLFYLVFPSAFFKFQVFMGKKAKRGKKNPQLKQSNLGIPRVPAAINIHRENPGKGPEPLRKKFSGLMFLIITAIVLPLLGVFGFDNLWPRVEIDSSQTKGHGIISYQFQFTNQPRYPVTIVSLDIIIVNLTLADDSTKKSLVNKVTFRETYTNSDVRIDGKDSVTIKIDDNLDLLPKSKLGEDSKIIIEMTYDLPFKVLRLKNRALFEANQEVGGNVVWVKKPLGEYAHYVNGTILALVESATVHN